MPTSGSLWCYSPRPKWVGGPRPGRRLALWCSLHAGGAEAQRCTDLVGKRDSNHWWLEWHLLARSRRKDEATQSVSSVLDQELDLGPGEAHALDAPEPATEKHMPVVLTTHYGDEFSEPIS